jgi:hypothetical protein
MFDRIRKVFSSNKEKRPAKSDFMRPKKEPARTPSVVSSDWKGPLPAIQDKPPVILLPSVTITTPPESKQAETPVSIVAPAIPPDIDPGQVAIVRHEAKKTSGEKFRYVDKPLKPLDGEARAPDVIKYEDKKSGETFKYKSAPVMPKAEGREKPAAEVFKYKPIKVEIKSQ